MTKIVVVAVVASLIVPAGLAAEEVQADRCLKCSIRQSVETLQVKPSRVGSAGALQQQSSRNGRGVGRSIAIGALVGAGGGAVIGGVGWAASDCEPGDNCGAGMAAITVVGAGIGALVGWAVGR